MAARLSRPVRAGLARRLWRAAIVPALCLGLTVHGAAAQEQRRTTMIRDAEVESLLRDYLNPLLRAARVRPTSIRLCLLYTSRCV